MSIRIVQTMLRAAGYDPGPVDGEWGPKTLAALQCALGQEGHPIYDPRTDNTGADVDPVLIADLKRDEGLRLTAYLDTVGVWTVGYGHAHVAPGTVWTQEKAEAQLIEDVREHNAKLAEALPWINDLDPVRRRVLQNMAFNLGIGKPGAGNGLLGFRNTLEFIRTGQYDRAADGMLASKWAKQVKGRAQRLATQMRTGRA